MPWKIVNLDYASDRPHLHLRDPAQPIHLRTYFAEKKVEVGLGADDPDDCFVRATVSADAVVVSAIRFEPLQVRILASILTSLDVEPQERESALAWMNERVRRGALDADGWLEGNVAEMPAGRSGWPYDLTDEALMDSIRDPGDMPSTRRSALRREAGRRGIAMEGGAPEVIRRRGRP